MNENLENLQEADIYQPKNEKQKEFVEAFQEKGFNGLLYAATRVGKSKVMIDCIAKLTKEEKIDNILWLVPTTKLKNEDMPQEFKRWGQEALLEKVRFECYASLKKLKGSKFDVIVLDEVHHLTKAKALILDTITTKKKMAITATKPDNEKRRRMIESMFEIVADYSVDQAVNDKVISNYQIYVVDLYLDNKLKYIKAGNKKVSWLQTEKEAYDWLDSQFKKNARVLKQIQIQLNYAKKRNDTKQIEELKEKLKKQCFFFKRSMQKRAEFIYTLQSKKVAAKTLLKHLPEEMRTLILTQRTEIADELCEHRYHTKDTKGYDLFCEGKTNKLSACRSLDEGVSLPNLDVVFIQQAWSTKRQFVQRAGRALGLREGHVGKIIALRVKGTQDETWVTNAISEFNNVEFISYNEMLNLLKQWNENRN